MKKIYILAFLLLLASNNIFSQSGWFWQNPLPQGNDLNCIKFIGGNTGWSVGNRGSIVKTIDNGNNWLVQNSGTINDLTKLYIVDSVKVIAIGKFGSIVRTTNGGLNWIFNQLTGLNLNLSSIGFFNSNTGWIVGYDHVTTNGYIYKTTDSGENWGLHFVSPSNHRFTSLFLLNESTGWANCSSTYSYKTTNSGINWVISSYISLGTDIHYKDNLNGLGISNYSSNFTNHGLIGKTTNGGINYYNLIDITDTMVSSIYMVDNYTGYISGQKGKIFKTTNYGDNWFSISTGYQNDFNSIYFKNLVSGITVGNAGAIYFSTNSGLNWVVNTKGILNKNLSACFFENAQTGYTVGENVILKTTNSGTNWNLRWDSTAINWRSLSFINSNTGFVLGNTDLIYKTSNKGENWYFYSDIETGGPPRATSNSISFLNESEGYSAGFFNWGPPSYSQSGLFCKTTNSGINWSNSLIGSCDNLTDLFFLNSNTGYMTGSKFTILKTTNKGSSWLTLLNNTATTFEFKKIRFVNEFTGWSIGTYSYNSNSEIYKTTNAGLNWQVQFLFFNEPLTGLFSLDENNVWVTSSKGLLYASSNSGINWYLQVTPSAYTLRSVYFISPNTGWCIGDKGIILKTQSGISINSINQTSSHIPQSFSLHQNYPNPFNPVTKIKFALPKQSFAKIVIYDLLGREITTLVNEQLKPGSYEVDWDGTCFASGVYFYSLVTESFVETKRMVLIK